MRGRTCITAACALLLPTLHGGALNAQGREDDSSEWVFGLSGWTVELHGGASRYGRFLLEAPNADPANRAQREVTAGGGFAFGGAIAAGVLPRTQARLAFTHSSTDLDYRDDTGDGSATLDLDGIGGLASEVVTLELTRFLVEETSVAVPYATAGFVGAWWVLDDAASVVTAPGGTQFRWGATATIGVQLRVARAFRLRFEAATASIGNPFEGSDSFLTEVGRTIDEPNRVTKRDYRIALAYVFGGSDRSDETSTARRRQ
jgi:hypothetical protein